MGKRGHIPIRMCIACRRRKSKEEMLQFIKGAKGTLFLNQKKRLSGRGFYVCPNRVCLKKAIGKEKGLELVGWKDIPDIFRPMAIEGEEGEWQRLKSSISHAK